MSDRILLVEPSVSDQRMVEMTLAAEFLDVVSVKDGAAALDELGAAAPSLVITDLELPDLSVPELVGKIRERVPGVPVLLIGADAEALSNTVREAGADDVLGKPFKAKELVDRIYRLMRSPGAVAAAADGDAVGELAADLGAADEGNFDLVGALENVASEPVQRDADFGQPDLDGPGAGIEVENTIVMRRDDLGALRDGMGVTARSRTPPPVAERSAEEEDDEGASEPDGFQTMIMSRDELTELRSRAEDRSRKPAAERPAPRAARPATGRAKPKPKLGRLGPADRVSGKPAAPGSRDAAEAIVREAATATEAELVAMLGRLDPAMSAQVRKVLSELVERVARRVATDVAAKRVDEEIGRLRRSLGEA